MKHDAGSGGEGWNCSAKISPEEISATFLDGEILPRRSPLPLYKTDPQRVGMCSGERPIGAAKGTQPNTEALCQAPPPLRPFQCWRLTAKILLRCQEDLRKILGPPSVGTIGGCSWPTTICRWAPGGGAGSDVLERPYTAGAGGVPPLAPPPDTTKTRSGPQRVGMCSGEGPIGAAKGTQPNTEALYHPPPPSPVQPQSLLCSLRASLCPFLWHLAVNDHDH